MFDQRAGVYLCLTESLIRHVDAPYTPKPLEVQPPLRILGLVASPREYPALDVEAEQENLRRALAKPQAAGQVELAWAPDASWDTIQELMLNGTWHILHFVGHGDFDLRTGEGALALVGPDGRADRVEAGRLTNLLSVASPTPQLVVLNSCSSGQSGAHDLFSSTAAALVHGGINAAAAMQFSVSDIAAVKFARGFYAAIAVGRPVDEALRSGRIGIRGSPGTLEWVTPVLYVRGGITQLFKLTGAPTPRSAAPRPRQAGRTATDVLPSPELTQQPLSDTRQAALRDLYIKAQGELRVQHYDTAIELLGELLTLSPDQREATDLFERARLGKQRAEAYARGRTAENTGDWTAATAEYDTVLQTDPSYLDASSRQENCRTQQQIADLKTELRFHYDAGNWQAVLDIDHELASLDPAATDLEGLTTKARAQLRQTDLEARYRNARASEEAHNWVTAAAAYAEIIQIDPSYQDAAARHKACAKRTQTTDLTARLPSGVDEEGRAAITEPQSHGAQSTDSRLISGAMRDIAAHLAQPVTRINFGGQVYSVSWHPGGDFVAVAGLSRWVRLYQYATGEQDRQFKCVSLWNSEVHEVDFSSDGTCLATGAKTAQIWGTATGTQLLEIRHGNYIESVTFSPDGKSLATGIVDGTARIWHVATGAQLLEVKHNPSILSVALSPDNTRLATSANTARIWDTATGRQLLEIRPKRGFLEPVRSVAFSPDGTRVATGAKTAQIWDTATGTQLLEVHHGIYAVAFSPDGKSLATGSTDKSARIWDTVTGKQLLEVHHGESVRSVAFSPDGTRLATGSADGTACIWRVIATD